MRDLTAPRPAGTLPDEGDGGGENAAALLARLNGSRGEGAAVSDELDVEEDGQFGGASEQEVAVHGMDKEVRWDGLLAGCETHGDHGATVDAAGTGGMPWLARIGEDILRLESVYSDGNDGYVTCRAGCI